LVWLVAPDSFKGTLAAPIVAGAIAEGLRAVGHTADVCPVADGGEGTLRVLLDACGGSIETTPARDPFGRLVDAEYGLLADGRTAVVETAEASGLGRVDPAERDAEAASSAGTGDLIAAAVRAGASKILLGVGGSACTDGGAGAVASIRDAGGLAEVDLEVLCDSRTPFESAAAVFAPQKGADEACVERLASRLDEVAASYPRDPRGLALGGCAGGLSGALWACFDARLGSGADAVLDAVAFDDRAAHAGRVITGEGRLDAQSVDGKLVSAVARRASTAGAGTYAIVGELAASDEALAELDLREVLIGSTPRELRLAGGALGRSATFDDARSRLEWVTR
jgi:glycerate 2-kinase